MRSSWPIAGCHSRSVLAACIGLLGVGCSGDEEVKISDSDMGTITGELFVNLNHAEVTVDERNSQVVSWSEVLDNWYTVTAYSDHYEKAARCEGTYRTSREPKVRADLEESAYLSDDEYSACSSHSDCEIRGETDVNMDGSFEIRNLYNSDYKLSVSRLVLEFDPETCLSKRYGDDWDEAESGLWRDFSGSSTESGAFDLTLEEDYDDVTVAGDVYTEVIVGAESQLDVRDPYELHIAW